MKEARESVESEMKAAFDCCLKQLSKLELLSTNLKPSRLSSLVFVLYPPDDVMEIQFSEFLNVYPVLRTQERLRSRSSKR